MKKSSLSVRFVIRNCPEKTNRKDISYQFIRKVLNLNVQFVKENSVEKTTCWHIKMSAVNVNIATNNFPRHRSF